MTAISRVARETAVRRQAARDEAAGDPGAADLHGDLAYCRHVLAGSRHLGRGWCCVREGRLARLLARLEAAEKALRAAAEKALDAPPVEADDESAAAEAVRRPSTMEVFRLHRLSPEDRVGVIRRADAGMRNRHIAREVGCHETTVSNILCDARARRALHPRAPLEMLAARRPEWQAWLRKQRL